MSQPIFYIPGNQIVQRVAGNQLLQKGYNIAPLPCPEITHLLLPVPSLTDNGQLKCGGDLQKILTALPKDITIIGGKIPVSLSSHYKTIDLLKDEEYLAQNAYITACCAMRIMMMELPVILKACKVLIIGWGRIAQCLAALLRSADADVTLLIRNSSQRAIASALGYRTAEPESLPDILPDFRVVCNTAPATVISEEQSSLCRDDCLKLDLASKLGIGGKHVIWARGLPGKDAPESSGTLIANTVIRLLCKEEKL